MAINQSSYWWHSTKAPLTEVKDTNAPVANTMVTLASVASSTNRTVAECKSIIGKSYGSGTDAKVNTNVVIYGGVECIALPLAWILL